MGQTRGQARAHMRAAAAKDRQAINYWRIRWWRLFRTAHGSAGRSLPWAAATGAAASQQPASEHFGRRGAWAIAGRQTHRRPPLPSPPCPCSGSAGRSAESDRKRRARVGAEQAGRQRCRRPLAAGRSCLGRKWWQAQAACRPLLAPWQPSRPAHPEAKVAAAPRAAASS